MSVSKAYENVIIFIMGFAGSGKLTVAHELVKHRHFKLVDADTIQNPIFKLVELDNYVPDYVWERVGPVRDAVLDTIEHLSPQHFSFVFTYEMFDNYDYSNLFFAMIKKVADKRKSIFVPVRLICEEDELVKRVQNSDRKKLFKIVDFRRSKHQCKHQTVFHSNEDYEITINNTEQSPEAVAAQILSHVDRTIKDKLKR